MYNKLELSLQYIQYYLTASNGKGHGIHAPFVYDFVVQVLTHTATKPEYTQVEQLRNNLLSNNQTITVQDYGAGSVTQATSTRTISSIATHAAKPAKYAQLLYRIAKYYNAAHIVELGTSLGISTAYLALANTLGMVLTCEGSPAIAQAAKHNFEKLFLNNITVLQGEFEQSYTKALTLMPSIDLLYIDGNHQYEPTVEYFTKALPHLHNNSIVILDDIHWSKPMLNAWHTIKQHSSVSESIDLFFIGILFFRKEQQAPQHFTIRF